MTAASTLIWNYRVRRPRQQLDLALGQLGHEPLTGVETV